MGLWCFLCLINFAGPKKEEEKIGNIITQPPNKCVPINKMKKKWVDDMTILVSLDLRKSLCMNATQNVIQPVPYHGRTGHFLPHSENTLQVELDKLHCFTETHHMKINQKKTKVALFNRHKHFDFTRIFRR